MNNKHNKQFRMLSNVQGVLDGYTQVWTPINAFAQSKNNLDEILSRITAFNKETGADSKGVTKTKESTREALAIKVSVLTGTLTAFASINGNENLMQLASITNSDILRAKENEVIALVSPVIDAARANLGELADYGLLETGIADVEGTLNDFSALIGKPREIKNRVYSAISSIDGLIDEGKIVIDERLDKLMRIFEQTNPEFFDQYKRARVIID